MSRPPKPVRWSKSPTGKPSLASSLRRVRSADPVRACEAMGEQPDQEGCREADHVQVVALDALDQSGAEPLDRVRAGTVLPLAARHVCADVARVQRTERDRRDLVVELFPRGCEQAKARDDLVRRARE